MATARIRKKQRKGKAVLASVEVPIHAPLKEIVAEASRALATLDAARLEELALSCEALNGGFEVLDGQQRLALAREAREAADGMATFARVLEVTRENLRVVERLRELRAGHRGYDDRSMPVQEWTESGHGND